MVLHCLTRELTYSERTSVCIREVQSRTWIVLQSLPDNSDSLNTIEHTKVLSSKHPTRTLKTQHEVACHSQLIVDLWMFTRGLLVVVKSCIPCTQIRVYIALLLVAVSERSNAIQTYSYVS